MEIVAPSLLKSTDKSVVRLLTQRKQRITCAWAKHFQVRFLTSFYIIGLGPSVVKLLGDNEIF